MTSGSLQPSFLQPGSSDPKARNKIDTRFGGLISRKVGVCPTERRKHECHMVTLDSFFGSAPPLIGRLNNTRRGNTWLTLEGEQKSKF